MTDKERMAAAAKAIDWAMFKQSNLEAYRALEEALYLLKMPEDFIKVNMNRFGRWTGGTA